MRADEYRLMRDKTVPGGSGEHTDAYANDLCSAVTNTVSEVDITYRHDPPAWEDRFVPQRSPDVKLEHPVKDVEELYHEAHLTVQFAEAHQTVTEERETPSSEGLSKKAVKEFDAAILAAADRALTAEGVTLGNQSEDGTLDELPGDSRRVLALLLHDAWAMDSLPRLSEHLAEIEETASLLSINASTDQSTFWRTHDTLKREGCREYVRNAATRAVHAVVRRGIVAPEDSIDAHGLDFSPVIDEREVAAETRRRAIRHWVTFLLDELLEPIGFDRAENREHAVNAIIGAVAQATYAHGLNSARPTAGWFYDLGDIPSASQVSRLLRSVTTQDITQMFTEVNRKFIQVASDHGFFKRDYDYALDTTWVTYGSNRGSEDKAAKRINNPKKGPSWLFAVLCVMDLDARFALGLDLVEEKSETTEQFRYLLRTAAVEGGVDRVHIDREFHDGDAVRMCRVIAGENWVIRAKRKGAADDLLAEVAEGESDVQPNVDFADVTPCPNLYVAPVPERYRDDGNTHMAFLSDLDPSEFNAREILTRYLKRWSAETMIRQLKHDVGVRTSSPFPEMRLFLLQIATLFYNIHTLVNRAPDPKYALRLDVPAYEVLIAIVDSVYTRRDGTEVKRQR